MGRTVNLIHQAELAASGFNQRLAVVITRAAGTMWCAYLFAVLAVLGNPGPSAGIQQWVQWVSQTFIQLVMLSVIMAGQAYLGRRQEIEADQSFADIEHIVARLETIGTRLDVIEGLLRGGNHGEVSHEAGDR